jgi:amino acid adenylation domain-containing protein
LSTIVTKNIPIERHLMTRIEEFILRTAERFPTSCALEHKGEQLTYLELREHAEALALSFRRFGIPTGAVVGVIATKSLNIMTLHLAIWISKLVLVPMDTEMPEPDLLRIFDAFGLHAIVVDNAASPNVVRLVRQVALARRPSIFCLDSNKLELQLVDDTFSHRHQNLSTVDPDPDLCYIYFTSGSTGTPKAIEGRHSSLIQYVDWFVQEFRVGPNDCFSQIAPLSFDFSLKEVFPALFTGGRVCLFDRAVARDPERFVDEVSKAGVTIVSCIPTTFRLMRQMPNVARSMEHVQLLLLSGEPLRWEDVRRWQVVVGAFPPLVNLYGPTECTATKCFYRIPFSTNDEIGPVPVGIAMRGAHVLILAEKGYHCEPGEIGEITIASNWLTRGYRTVQGEHVRAFSSVQVDDAELPAFRTGDLGRWLPDGNLELLGRIDRQLKINGHRVELNAIETIIAAHPAVRDASVIVMGQAPNQVLVGFYTCEVDQLEEIGETSLRQYLRQHLIAAAIPSRLVRLKTMPTTHNGKVSHAELAGFVLQQSPQTNSTPTNMLDRVARVWQQILGSAAVNCDSDFYDIDFYDVGGTSVLEFHLFRQLQQCISPDMKFSDFIQHTTIRQQANWLEDVSAKSKMVLEKIEGSGDESND